MEAPNVALLGRLLPAEPALPTRVRTLFEGLLGAGLVRSAGSAGAVLQVHGPISPRHLAQSCTNPQRGDLSRCLGERLDCAARFERPFGGSFLLQAQMQEHPEAPDEPEVGPFRFLSAEQRGPRGVQRRVGARIVSTLEPAEMSLTHDGTFVAVRFRRVRLTTSELARLLERVLGSKPPSPAEAVLLAGLFELFTTQGMWAESLRLAYQLVVAPAPNRVELESHPAPALADLERWALPIEALTGEVGRVCPELGRPEAFRRLSQRIVGFCNGKLLPELEPELAERFAHVALGAYLDNDLYAAANTLAPLLEGTFGCVVTTTLEPGSVVALSRGRPLSVGIHEASGTAAIVSEGAGLGLRIEGQPAFDRRLDLDMDRGEVAQVRLSYRGVHLTLRDFNGNRDLSGEELLAAGRMIPTVVGRTETELSRTQPSFVDDTQPRCLTPRGGTVTFLGQTSPDSLHSRS